MRVMRRVQRKSFRKFLEQPGVRGRIAAFFEGEGGGGDIDGKLIRSGDEDIRDIAWLTTAGIPMTPDDWNSGFQCVAVFLNGEAIPAPNSRGERVIDDTFLLCFNAHGDPVEFIAAEGDYAAEWTGALDTATSTGSTDLVVKAGEAFTLQGRSVIVLRKTA